MFAFRQIIVIAMIISFLTLAPVSASVLVDGLTWDHAYTGDGDVLPTASTPAWISNNSGSASVTGGELTIDTTVVDRRDFQLTQVSGGAYDPQAGNTTLIQFRMKLNSIAAGTRFGTQIFISGQNKFTNLLFGTFNGRTGVFNAAQQNLVELDLSTYHTYRVAFDSAVGYSLWIDDFVTPIIADAALNNTSVNRLRFGDFSGDVQGSATYDYVAWTNNIPEPASLALIGMGGLMLLRGRK